MGVPHHHGVPDAPGLAQVEEQPHHEHQIADEGRELGGPKQRLELFQVEDIDGRGHGEAAGGQGHPGEHVEADPQAPGVGVVQVGGGAQPKEEPDDGGDQTQHQDDIEDGVPGGQLAFSRIPLFHLFNHGSVLLAFPRFLVLHFRPALVEVEKAHGQAAHAQGHKGHLGHPLPAVDAVGHVPQVGAETPVVKPQGLKGDRGEVELGRTPHDFLPVHLGVILPRVGPDAAVRFFQELLPLPKEQGLGGADGGAGRGQTDLDPVGAEVAFPDQRHRRAPLELGNLERAGHHAVTAADAAPVIINHRPIFQFRQGPHRADADAGRVITMHAPPGNKVPAQLPVGLDLLPENDPGIVVAVQMSGVAQGLAERRAFTRQVVPALAGHLAAPATDTAGRIDQHGFTHGSLPCGLLDLLHIHQEYLVFRDHGVGVPHHGGQLVGGVVLLGVWDRR